MYFQSRDMVIHRFLPRNARLPAKKTRGLCNLLSQRSLLKSRFELGTFKDRIGAFNVVEPWYTNRVMFAIKVTL